MIEEFNRGVIVNQMTMSRAELSQDTTNLEEDNSDRPLILRFPELDEGVIYAETRDYTIELFPVAFNVYADSLLEIAVCQGMPVKVVIYNLAALVIHELAHYSANGECDL